MDSFSKYNISVRTVQISDANMIVALRTDDKKSRFISSTSKDIIAQEKWIAKYKEREKKGEEYYFIATDEEGEEFATYRVYDILSGIPEIGSWVSKPNYKKGKNAIKIDIIIKDFVFSTLKFDILKFEVRKANTSVVKYHRLFGPKTVNETNQDIFFHLDKEAFYKHLNKFIKQLN